MKCPRCSGFAHIYQAGWHSEADDYLRCLICGIWIPRPRLTVIITVAEIEAGLAPRGIIRRSCSVKDCAETVRQGGHTNERGMCARHYRMLTDWQRTKRNTPPPLIAQDGVWIENPHRLRAGRGAKPRRRKCRECGEVKSIQADELCGRCWQQAKGLPPGYWRKPKYQRERTNPCASC